LNVPDCRPLHGVVSVFPKDSIIPGRIQAFKVIVQDGFAYSAHFRCWKRDEVGITVLPGKCPPSRTSVISSQREYVSPDQNVICSLGRITHWRSASCKRIGA